MTGQGPVQSVPQFIAATISALVSTLWGLCVRWYLCGTAKVFQEFLEKSTGKVFTLKCTILSMVQGEVEAVWILNYRSWIKWVYGVFALWKYCEWRLCLTFKSQP